ncbi:unnamed protein product [Lactuca saligna]|uniref:Uncharacterized protein n=1 Tax=Lactuca saligna TaxID=75948 RepID=A0AA35Y218_LACSI|nr:unnamed protein product [Lactuca saligna]
MLRKLYVEEEEEEDFGPIYDTDEKVEEFKEVEQVLDHEDVVVVKKDDDTLITNRLSKKPRRRSDPSVPSSKQLRGREFIMLGFLFLWCTFSWEAMLLEHVVHQPTSTKR